MKDLNYLFNQQTRVSMDKIFNLFLLKISPIIEYKIIQLIKQRPIQQIY